MIQWFPRQMVGLTHALFYMSVSPLIPQSFFILPQDKCNLCVWADMHDIFLSLSLNGLIKTSVHKVLTTFCCSLNISVNPVFSFEFGWLSLHSLVVSQCRPPCHRWGTWFVWISFHFLKICLFMRTCWGWSSCTLVSLYLKLVVVSGKYVLVWGIFVEKGEVTEIEPKAAASWRSSHKEWTYEIWLLWTICEHIWLHLLQYDSLNDSKPVFLCIAAQQYSRIIQRSWKCWQLTDVFRKDIKFSSKTS